MKKAWIASPVLLLSLALAAQTGSGGSGTGAAGSGTGTSGQALVFDNPYLPDDPIQRCIN